MSETIHSRDLISTRFENTIKSIINYFFYKKQGGLVPSYSSLLNRWEKLWFSKDVTSYDIIHEQHESFYGNTASLTSRAAAVLLEFYNVHGESNAIPLAIDESFHLPVDKHSKVKGKFDLITFDGSNYLVYKWVFNFRSSHSSLYQMDFAVLHDAFKHKFNTEINKAKFGYYDLASSSQKFIVEKDDSQALKYWCATIEEDNKFAPRRGLTSYCKKCPFDAPCSKWKDWE
jgi:hypothetical protein